MKIVFMGTPDFAVPCLQVIIENKYEIAAVVTQPDRPKGRGNAMTAPPVKVVAVEHGIQVYQPEKIKTPEAVKFLKEMKPDIIIVVAFGQILSQEILDIPALGCVNVHASLLPRYRGAAPINWCIINGDEKTGVTTMYMDKGLDTGDMIISRETPISSEETAGELHDRMALLGAETLIETVRLIEEGRAPRTPQNNDESTYAPIMTKALGRIDWSKSALEVRNLIRGTYPWPGAFSSYGGRTFKIFKAEMADANARNKECGLVAHVDGQSFTVNCGVGSLRIKELQFENEKRMSVEAYLRGHNIEEGTILE
jgi:methionyl-tRNA formyltransferase